MGNEQEFSPVLIKGMERTSKFSQIKALHSVVGGPRCHQPLIKRIEGQAVDLP
ncbi:hypothetical protein HanRHA438_Chr11g0499071 [Helianthus annuus]|nr:hypothetical protein HanRHA438_Chr11g0499071 [Helianthus annuus]